MRSALNSWLRRWAEASLRTELHQAQERLIRQQEKYAKALAHAEGQEKARSAKEALKKQKAAKAVAPHYRPSSTAECQKTAPRRP